MGSVIVRLRLLVRVALYVARTVFFCHYFFFCRLNFSIKSKAAVNRLQYTFDQIAYVKKYILKDGPENYEQAKRRHRIFVVLDRTLGLLLLLLLIRLIYRFF